MKTLTLIVLLLWTAVCTAATQDHATLRSLAAHFVQQQTADLPGKVAITVDEIDKRIAVRPCSKLEAFLPGGSQLMGRVSVGVRCLESNGWSLFIPVQIKVTRELLVSARALTMGQVLHEEDISRLNMELTQNSGITDPRLVVGKVLRYSIAAGLILREDMLRAPYSVKQGQSVKLTIQGSGFTLSSSGVALNNAGEGESVQIRTSSGRVISGIATEEGIVRISP